MPDGSCEKTHGCNITLPGSALPQHYPGGFCWNVVSVAANGQRSAPSAMHKYTYEVDAAKPVKPGVAGPTASGGEGIIAGDSYDKDVDFAWTLFPGALLYNVEVDPVFATKPRT